MAQFDDASHDDYPHGRGYGHDYMRGGEVLGGYGYAEREEYAKRRGELMETDEHQTSTTGDSSEAGVNGSRGEGDS